MIVISDATCEIMTSSFVCVVLLCYLLCVISIINVSTCFEIYDAVIRSSRSGDKCYSAKDCLTRWCRETCVRSQIQMQYDENWFLSSDADLCSSLLRNFKGNWLLLACNSFRFVIKKYCHSVCVCCDIEKKSEFQNRIWRSATHVVEERATEIVLMPTMHHNFNGTWTRQDLLEDLRHPSDVLQLLRIFFKDVFDLCYELFLPWN